MRVIPTYGTFYLSGWKRTNSPCKYICTKRTLERALRLAEKLVKKGWYCINIIDDASDNVIHTVYQKNDKKMTYERMKGIIAENVPFSKLKKDKGICEFYAMHCNDSGINKSIGISYEDIDDEHDVYIYNIFIDSEYINISGHGTKDNRLPDDVLTELVAEWNKF